MTLEPKIVTLKAKKLIGHSIEMCLMDNKTLELFSGFMPKKRTIKNVLSDAVFEVMIYNKDHFKSFSPKNTFTKWASVEVSHFETTPTTMKPLKIKAGLYLQFKYIGLPQGFGELMRYILTDWLPKSKYQLDNRPHFNVLGKKYVKKAPDSEEDVFIPVKLKA